MWLDNASDIDILFYEPYARIIADIAKNEQYNPLTVGVFGLWGAGKSTLLKLIGEKLKSQDGIICVTINAWMFESYDDAKTAIMEALLQELKEEVPVEETKKKLGKLIKRVDWFKLGTKAISTLAPVVASVATGNPLPMLLNVTGSAEEIGNTVKNAANSIQSLKDEYWKEEDASNDESTINNIRKFREEFSDALKSDDIKNVVVMIDDLDRCRPERIIEILEVIKLFLSVDRTENKEFKEIRTKVMEGNVDAQNPWNTSQIKKWLECKPVELEKYRLEKYFYLTRENLKRSSIDESGFSKNTKEILERIGRAKSGQMVAIIKDMEKLRAEEIADTFKVVVSKIEKGEMKFFVVRDLFLNFDAYKGKIVDAIGKSTVPIKAGDMAALRTMYNSDTRNMNTVLETMVKRGTLTDEQITEIKEQRKS